MVFHSNIFSETPPTTNPITVYVTGKVNFFTFCGPKTGELKNTSEVVFYIALEGFLSGSLLPNQKYAVVPSAEVLKEWRDISAVA